MKKMPVESPRSTLMFSAQTRSYELKVSESTEVTTPSKTTAAKAPNKQQTPVKKLASQRVYSLLPKYNTPVRKPIRNPFNEKIIDIFNAPICSPDLCASVPSPSEPVNKNGDFFWTAEDLWRIDPAPIESPQTDLEDHLDEETESLAQEAIERYFKESHNILSPIGSPSQSEICDISKRGVTPDLPTPKCHSDRAMSTPCTRYDSRCSVKSTVGTQTSISFSCDIPDELLDLLKPYINQLDESQQNTSHTTSFNLRRKLLFNELCESPVDSDEEANDGENRQIRSRFLPSDWTPDKVQSTIELFSKSPDISPIAEGILVKDRSIFNFTREMAIDVTTSPIKGNHPDDEEQQMSIDFGTDSTIDVSRYRRQSSQTSADTGYGTNASEKSRATSSERQSDGFNDVGKDGVEKDGQFVCSYISSMEPSTSRTGLTSTPALDKYRPTS